MSNINTFKKILFCTDFNSDADRAFHYCVDMAAANENSEIIIFHAIPEPDAQFWKSYLYEVENVEDKARRDMDAKIKEIYLKDLPDGIRVTTRYVPGNVGSRILEEAENEKVDLIVIGRGPGVNLINRMLGNFTEKIVRNASCPVLVVPS